MIAARVQEILNRAAARDTSISQGRADTLRPVWPDMRLVGATTGAWLATVWALYLTSRQGIVLAAAAAAAALVLATANPALHAVGAVVFGKGDRAFHLAARWARAQALVRAHGPTVRWIVVGFLIGAACGAASTAAHVVVRERQPIAGLAAANQTATVTATIASDPHAVGTAHIGPPTYGVNIDVSSVTTGEVRTDVAAPVLVLASGTGWLGLLPGQRIVAHGRFEPAEPGELDVATMSISSPPTLVGRAPWLQRAAGSLRAGLQRACSGLTGPVRGLLPGLIDGDTSQLDPGLSASFRTTGMTHLLAVSGSNVVMIIGAVLFAARWCRAGPTVTALCCALALAGFVILVRPSPSVLRAAAMGAIGLAGLATGRARSAVPALAAATFALLVYDPALGTDIGFGLSVFATAGLLLIAPHWRFALRRRGVPAGVAEAIAVPSAAQAACSPLIAGFSGVVSFVAVPANLLAAPAVPLATITGVGAALISPIWPAAAAFLAWLAAWPARWLIFVAEHGAQAPAAVASWPSGTWGALALLSVIGGAMFALRYRTARVIAAVSLVAALVGVVPVRLASGGWPPIGAVLVVCDVGQGDGMVLPVGPGKGIVVDSGTEPTPIDGCLSRLGIYDIPILFFTHFHMDHVGGFAGVLDGRTVDQIVTSPFPQPEEGYHDVVTMATARHIPMSTPSLGQVFTVGPLRLTVLGPISRLVGTRSDPNNNSIVMMAQEAGLRILLTGDAEVEEQAQVLAADGAAALRCDLLKVPHHGSAYQDPAFLAAADPAAAFVSVGAVNPYGLPNLPMLSRLTSLGARVLRTDQSGDLAALSENGRLAVELRGVPAGQHPT